jgi:hypothetical protein
MNYQLIHDSIIDKAKTRVLPKETYTERHHIKPRCMGGTDDKSNLVDLTAKEHFIVHKLLVEIHPDVDGLVLAYYLFVNGVNKMNHKGEIYYKVGAREYERVKGMWSEKMRLTVLPKLAVKLKKSEEQFIYDATQLHGDVYEYSKVIYVNAHTKVIIGCKEHGEFIQIPNKHLSGRGCQKCGFTKNGLKTKERMSNGKSYKSLKVINKETGEVFVSIKDAAQSNGINVITLTSKVMGRRTNNTPFVLV